MKQILTTLVVLLLLSSQNSWAQVELRFAAGYNLASSTEPSPLTQISASADGTTESNLYFSLGEGFTADLGIAYKFSDVISAELGFQYLVGASQTLFDVNVTESPTDMSSELGEARTQQLRLTPSVIVKAPMEGNIKPYGRFGLVLPVLGSTTSEQTSVEMTGGVESTTVTQARSTGAFSLGFMGGVGAMYQVSDRMSVSLEAQYTGLRIRSNELEVTSVEVTAGGSTNDVLSTLSVYDTQTVYVDELTPESNVFGNDTYDENQPEEALRESNNFNAFGIQLGVWFSF